MLAQLGEHLGDNQEVGSSSLPQITNTLKLQGFQRMKALAVFLFFVLTTF